MGDNRITILGRTGLTMAYQDYAYKAKQRKLKFDLTKEQFKEIVTQNCYYCNAIPQTVTWTGKKKGLKKSTREKSKFIRNGIDRKNNLKGYTIKNSLPCCKHCNRAKYKMNIKQFRNWITKVYKYWIERI